MFNATSLTSEMTTTLTRDRVHNRCLKPSSLAKKLKIKLSLQSSLFENPFKNKRIPLLVTSTRYSLVKGERIVCYVLITRFRGLHRRSSFIL